MVIALLIYNSWNKAAELNALREQHLKQLEDQKKIKQKEVDSLSTLLASETADLNKQIDELTEYSEKLVTQIKQYKKRPDIDIDFVTAANIISESNYRPDK